MSKKEIVEEIHKPARKHFKRRKVVIKGFDDLWQIDLVDMSAYSQQNRGFKFLLTVIDCFSKYSWAIPTKDKSAISVTNAMKKVFNQGFRFPKHIQSDDGLEFFNKNFSALMKKFKINHYSVFSSLKASIIERYNRSLKSLMWKQFSLNGTYRWVDTIDQIVNEYNNRVHRTIKMKPALVTKDDEKRLLSTVYSVNEPLHVKTKFKIGDHVRISKYKHIFEKQYTPNWTTEIFRISKIQYTDPETYLLVDGLGNPIKGGFYKFELLKVKHPDAFLVERILKRQGQKVLVRWLGLSEEHDSWIDKKDIL